VFIKAKDDGGGGDNWTTGAITRAKLQSNHHHQQTNILFLQAGCPSCHQTNSVQALKGNHIIIIIILFNQPIFRDLSSSSQVPQKKNPWGLLF